MSFASLLNEGQVVVGFAAKDKPQAIAGLVDVLAAVGRLTPPQRAAAVDALLAREKIGSTGLEHGIALPHAIVDIPGEALAVLAVSRDGVPFQAADGAPSRLLVLLLVPRRAVQKHLRTLAEVARLLDRPDVRESLLKAKSAKDALEIVRAAETGG
ncbi:MAG TPA: PTS sugar transporter subunit IIA [Planctomycetota bacterium]|nr:PTS sugar transporter subunit IIA [Planctomycetota bacterium]